MFTDKKRAEVQDQIRQHDQALFAHILTPELFFQAAQQCGLKIILSPLNLINLVWLAVSAARNPGLCFADLLGLSLKTLQDHESFPTSVLAQLLGQPDQRRHEKLRHDPRKGPAEPVTEAAFSKARQRMPSEFWVALFLLLADKFQRLHADVVRWGRFRLLAIDGTGILLPDWPALRAHFGTPRNSGGSHGAQARLMLLQFPLARLPYAHILAPWAVGEISMARQLLQGLRPDDLILLDAGFLCYGLFWQIHRQGAYFCVRLRRNLNLRATKELRKETGANDVLVEWTPKDSRSNWRKEGLPPSMTLRLLTYHAKGLRPLRLLTNVLSEPDVPYEQFWGLSVSGEGEVLFKGIYQMRWEIEISYLELKVQQRLERGLRSRTPEGIDYEVAGHILHYLLVRWWMVEAAAGAKVSPLRLSFTEALREINEQWPSAVVASAPWLQQTLRPRLLQRLARHQVEERPGRTAPRGEKARRADKRAKDAQRAKDAKQRPSKKDKPRRWFGQGWDLAGPKVCPAASLQG
jgi:Transposase DDE domain